MFLGLYGNSAETVALSVAALFVFFFFNFIPFVIPFIFLGIFFSIFVLKEIASSIALYMIAKEEGYKSPWFAFIPYLKTYLKLNLPKSPFKFFSEYRDVDKVSLYSTLGILIYDFLLSKSGMAFLGDFKTILLLYRDYRLYEYYQPDNAVEFAIIKFVCPVSEPILLFVIYGKMKKNRT